MFFTYFDRYRQMIFFHIFREKYKFACINAYQHNRIDYAYSYMVLSNAGDEIVFDTHCMWCVYACVGEIRYQYDIYEYTNTHGFGVDVYRYMVSMGTQHNMVGLS